MTQGKCALLLLMCGTAWACMIDSDCETGNCIRGWLSSECGKPANSLDGGDACSASAECKSGNCLNRVFATDRCSHEKHTKKADQACDVDEECKSNKCFEGYFYKACTKNVTSLTKGQDCYSDSECASRNCYHKSLLTWECTSNVSQAGDKPCDVNSDCKSNSCSQSMLFGDKCQHEQNILEDNAVCQSDNECKSKKCEIEKFWHTQGTCQSTPLGGNQSQLSRNAYEAPMPIGAKRCSKHTDCTLSKECIWPMGGVFGWVAEGYCRRADKTQATGKLCSMDEECADGNCRSEYLTSVCAPKKGSVQAEADCYSHSDCASTRCLDWSVNAKGKCAKINLAVNADCAYAFQCKSGLCPESKCVANRTALPAANCDNHVECASGYCIGLWRPWGGKCDNQKSGLVGGKNCNRDDACSSGLCDARSWFGFVDLKFGFFDAGRCTPEKNSVDVGQKCKLDQSCKSKYCIKGSMTAITGQICGNERNSLAEKASCKTDTECTIDHLCSGKYLGSGKCVKANSTYTYAAKRNFNKVLSFPGRMYGGSKSVVRKYIGAWQLKYGKTEDVGVVETKDKDGKVGKKDLIENPMEIWLYDHLVMVVISIVGEMASRIEATGFGGELETLVEGVMDFNGTEMPTGGEAGVHQFIGSNETMEWIDDLMDNENWYFDTNVTGTYISFMQPLIPHRLIKSMIRESMGIGVGFLESTLKTAEARIVGRWMKNAKAASKARRLAYAEGRTGFNTSNTTIEKAEKDLTAAQKGFNPQEDPSVSEIAASWWTSASNLAKSVGNTGYRVVSSATTTVANHDWTKSLIKNMIGCMLMATHRMLSVGMELPFIFEEHLRLRRTDEDKDVTEEKPNYIKHVTAEVCKTQPTKKGCDVFEQENTTDGYGKMGKYQRSQVASASLKTFIEDFNKAYPNISHDGNLGLLKFCDPFGSGQGRSVLPSSSKCLGTCEGGKRCQNKVCGTTESQHSNRNTPAPQGSKTERCQKGTVAGASCDGMSFFSKSNRHTPSCTTCHGIPWFPNFCKANNVAWIQKGGYGNAGKNCAWVAQKPRTRCTLAGANGKLAFEDCMQACYYCKTAPANLYSQSAGSEGCVVADLIDDNVLMERFADIAIAFFSSAIVNSEVRMFQQRYHMVFKTSSPEELTRKFSSYLQKHKSKLPMDQVKAWIDARYKSKLMKAKEAEIEKVLNVTMAGSTQAIISTDGLQKFAVKSVILCLQFLEMALLDTKINILGVQYEVIATRGEAGHQQKSIENLLKTATTSPVDVDWNFVDNFVDEWYTKYHKDVALPRTSVEVNTFFQVDVGFLVPLEKLICKLSFGAAMDVVNANFRQMELPLPLVHANKGVHLVENHPDSTAPIPVPKTKMTVSTRVKAGDWFRTFLPILTAAVNGSVRNKGDAIGSLDPVRSIRSDPTAVERRIESINARSTCGYVLKNLAGLGSLEFDNVEVTADFPWGAGSNCKVCTQSKACGNNCIRKNLNCTITTGCAVSGDKMGTDLEFSGRFLRNKQIEIYSRVCTGGKACGNSCIDSKKSCRQASGSACNAEEVICRVCTGGRKACDDKCVPAAATCAAKVGCARNVADFADIDLTAHSKSTGKFSFKATELSVQAEVTAKADACGTAVGTDGCCAGEEKFPRGAGAKCYASCNATTGGTQPDRVNACTCRMKVACTSNEEIFNGRCYKKCSALTGGSHPVRSGPNTCKMSMRCKPNEEEFSGIRGQRRPKCYKKCSILTRGDQPIRHFRHVCRKAVKCQADEEVWRHRCFKKCSKLTGFSHPVRAGYNTCKKTRKCANNEEAFENRCYKKCSVLTRGERPHRLSAYTCSPSPDQIEARLTAAGAGRGEIGVTLSWDTKDDLDIYVQPPGHRKIYYGRKNSAGGKLDIDANAGQRRRYNTRPIENVFWPPLVNNRGGPPQGEYKVWFKVYRSRTRRRGNINWKANVKVAGQSNRYSGSLRAHRRRDQVNRRRPSYYLGAHDVSGRTYSGPAANPPVWEAETSGQGCSGYGVSGDGSCAKPFYHVWTKGRGCRGFRVAADGGCPNRFYDKRRSGNGGCGGYAVAADGGCPNKPYDSWTKGRGCSGFGIAGDLGCAVPLYHPTTNCAKFGVAANGGLAHLPFIAPKTLVTNSKLQNFKGAASFAALLNPTTLKLESLEVTRFEATWDDLRFRLPELGVFSVHAEAIRTAMSDGLENHFNSLLAMQVSKKLSSVCKTQVAVINDKIDFSKCLREVRNRDLHTGGRRLAQSDIHAGHLYTVSENGHVEPRLASECDASVDEEEDGIEHAAARALGAESPLQMASVQVELVAHGVAYNKLENNEVVTLAEAMLAATADYAGVAETDVITVPKLENDFETTRVSIQISVESSEKDALIAKFRQFQGKAFESAVEGSIKALELGVAKADLVVVSTEKIVDGDKTITFDEVESQDIFT